MTRNKIEFNELGVTAESSVFTTENGVAETHVMVHVEARESSFTEQYQRLKQGVDKLLRELSEPQTAVVFKRYFLSDATNQRPLMDEEDSCTVSYIQQPPLDGSKLALWMYLVKGAEVTSCTDELASTVVKHNGYEHIWTMGMNENTGDSYHQTEVLLSRYETMLAERSANIADNCTRTWFFVRDVDTNYHGLVVARRENFEQNGLRQDTHYLASTGIGGSPADTKSLVQLDTYAIKGLEEGQQQYLYALSHLNKTIEYGVTFERGTVVKYGDRAHAFISGTASINNKGEVVHVGEIKKQTLRMWENVGELLKEGGMSFDDVMQIIVYLRDISDYEVVQKMFSERFPSTPYVITLAPVCRPTWLIEMECVAVAPCNSDYRDF